MKYILVDSKTVRLCFGLLIIAVIVLKRLQSYFRR